MERKGAAYRITSTKKQEDVQPQARGLRTIHPWTTTSNPGDHSYTNDNDAALALSVSHHPSGGFNAEAANYNWDQSDPDVFSAGPFRTPKRAQVAAEALGQRSLTGPTPERYRKPR